MFKSMGGNIPGGNLLGGNFPGGKFLGGSLMGGSFPDTIETINKSLQLKNEIRVQ